MIYMKIMIIIIYKKKEEENASSRVMKPDVCLKCFSGIRPMTDKGEPRNVTGKLFLPHA